MAAIVSPYQNWSFGLPGEVCGSGSITIAKKKIVGSSNILKKVVSEKVKVEIWATIEFVNKNVKLAI